MTTPHPHAARRRAPSQHRSRDTVDAICAAATAILVEEGITAFTTNAVARRAGVSITSLYAFFPNKWSIVHELSERFERLRGDYIDEVFAQLATADDWRALIGELWRRLAELRVSVPGGVALRQALGATPELVEIDREQSRRAAAAFADAILARRPDLDPADVARAAWASTISAGTLLDDICWTGAIDEPKLAVALELTIRSMAPYMDPAPAP